MTFRHSPNVCMYIYVYIHTHLFFITALYLGLSAFVTAAVSIITTINMNKHGAIFCQKASYQNKTFFKMLTDM